ncbi:NADH:flavin oxidoreductase/NADH oxidase [Kwoniella heveanensis BCC8398]|uniref:NADH:flavin oxidoreductase/NADH oxidase n=1 Tax=Kwoniella heveanensis BCC8398 TaxID=1296120 RepID=A0A1B9GR33_9TREE|nr:NADH:flavin oxidoreductase/NADH oxidase [Kwoniella heveanensis BCC8398]
MTIPSASNPGDSNDDIDLIASRLTLPNGVVVPNRLVKAAMAEGIGLGGGPPRAGHFELYRRWANGGWGMILSGNVQIDPRHLASPHDLTITPSAFDLKAYTKLASIVHKVDPDTLLLMQISHPGLQSSSMINLSRWPWEPAIAPCEARPDISGGGDGGGGFMSWIWGHAMWPTKSRKIHKVEEWLDIVERFVGAAVVAEKAGWDGAQVHSAHGYLLAEYLSPLTNHDPAPLPGVPEIVPIRLHLLYLILRGIRDNTNSSFVKAVKINCSDFVQGGLDENQATEIVHTVISWQMVDIIEISGGTYAQPAFASPESLKKTPSARQSLFAHFTTSLLPSIPSPPEGPAIILTGGLHDRTLIASSIRDRACDLTGIGRPACMIPDLPDRIILNPTIQAKDAELGGYSIPGREFMKTVLGGANPASNSGTKDRSTSKGGIPLVGAGVSTLWHEWQMCRIGRGLNADYGMHWLRGFLVEEVWWEVLYGLPVGWWNKGRR